MPSAFTVAKICEAEQSTNTAAERVMGARLDIDTIFRGDRANEHAAAAVEELNALHADLVSLSQRLTAAVKTAAALID